MPGTALDSKKDNDVAKAQSADVTPQSSSSASASTSSAAQAVDPATLTAYDKTAFLKVVTEKKPALAIKLAAFNPAQAITDLGSHASDFYDLVRTGKPFSSIARAQLNTIYSGLDFANQQLLFSAQFNVQILGTGATKFTQAELQTLYSQARLLPPNQVEGNPSWVKLLRQDGVAEGSFGGDTINMGTQHDAARYAQVFRHEVGHAVDDRLGGLTADLRVNQAGWKEYGGVDDWITALGGYDGVPTPLQATVKKAAQAYLGAGGTFSPPTEKFEDTLLAQIKLAHPGVTPASDGSDAVSKDLKALQAAYGSSTLLKALLASQGTCNYWRFDGWPEASGKVFFINHYYAKPFSLSSATWSNLKAWGDSAAAFSDKEWFAEVYADWYQHGIGGAHTAFPDYVTTFFNNVVEKMGAGATAPAQPTTPSASGDASSGGGSAATAKGSTMPKLPGDDGGGGGGNHPSVPRG